MHSRELPPMQVNFMFVYMIAMTMFMIVRVILSICKPEIGDEVSPRLT